MSRPSQSIGSRIRKFPFPAVPEVSPLLDWAISLVFLLLPVGTSPSLIAVGLCGAVWIANIRKRGEIQPVPKYIWLPAALFVLLPWTGLLHSLEPDLGTDYAMKTKYWLLFIVMAFSSIENKAVPIFLKALWLSLTLGALLAALQVSGLVPLINKGHAGFGTVHTQLAIYLVIGILMAAFYFERIESPGKKVVLLLMIGLFVFHLAVLRGRGGYLLLILVSPLVAGKLMYRFSVVVKACAISVFLLIFLLSPVFQARVSETVDMIRSDKITASFTVPDKEFPRPFMLAQAWEVFLEHPLTGAGTGSLYALTKDKGLGVEHPHNNILYMGASFGIAGIISLLWLFGTMVTVAWKNRHTPLGYFVFSSGLVLFIGGLFDTLVLNTGTLLMLVFSYGLLCRINTKSNTLKLEGNL